MPTVREMSEAHLANVSNQITMLREQQQKLTAEIDNLVDYLAEGSSEIAKAVEKSNADVVSVHNQQTF